MGQESSIQQIADGFAQSALTPADFDQLKKQYQIAFWIKLPFKSPILEELKEDAWKKAVESVSVKFAPKKAEPIVQEATQYNVWGFKVVKARHIGELVRLTVELSDESLRSVTMEMKDLYSQQRFREQFSPSTNILLPTIKKREFEEIIMAIQLEEVMDTGTSLQDLLTDVLMTVKGRCLKADSLEEAEEFLKDKGYCIVGDLLRFKISKLRAEYELRGVKPERLVQTIEDIGAKKISRGVYEWKHL